MKNKRLNRLFKEDGKIMILPLDHGATLGPVKGLEILMILYLDWQHELIVWYYIKG